MVKFTFSTAEKGVGGWRGQTYHRLDDNKASKGPSHTFKIKQIFKNRKGHAQFLQYAENKERRASRKALKID